MTSARTWAAAGTTVATLAGGLFLGAPAAVAAPGDAACVQATQRFDAALAAAGITPESLTALDRSADAVAAAEARYAELVEGAGGPSLQELEAAGAALLAAQQSGDPEAIARAEARVLELDAALAAALGTLDPAVAEQAVADAAAVFETLLAELALDEASANQLLGLLEQVVVACQGPAAQAPVVAPAPPAPVVVPVVPAPVVAPGPAGPAVEAPVGAAPAVGAPAEAAPAPVNPGINMQAAVAEPEERSGAVLPAALLAAGLAVSAAAAMRLHRRGRS